MRYRYEKFKLPSSKLPFNNRLYILYFIFYINTTAAIPNGNSSIEWAVLYEAAGYRHDLYYQFGDIEGYIATNNWNTGGANGCDFCSYPGEYGTIILGKATDKEIIFRLEINNGALQPLFSGSRHNNPDNLIHAWFSNAEGLSHIDDNLLINAEHESFDISTLFEHYKNNKQINALLTSQDTRFVGFEDILFGGDLDYNDIIFAFRGVSISTAELATAQVPEPSSSILLLFGIIFLVIRSKTVF